jgi:hypothetical protein
MKQQLNTNLLIRSSLALALALAIWTPAQSQSAEPAEGKMMMGDKMMADSTNAATPDDMSQPPPMTKAKMMAACQKMKEQKQKMKEDMMAQGAQLTEQIAKMNRAPADQKQDLMAAILTRMEAQKLTMDARKAKMEEAMMQHMMQHMQMGKDSMAQCPMMKDMKGMKGMKGMDEKSGDVEEEQK